MGARAAMEAWIERHPPRPGDAWHPYPLSTRVGNWLAALALVPEAANGIDGASGASCCISSATSRTTSSATT